MTAEELEFRDDDSFWIHFLTRRKLKRPSFASTKEMSPSTKASAKPKSSPVATCKDDIQFEPQVLISLLLGKPVGLRWREINYFKA